MIIQFADVAVHFKKLFEHTSTFLELAVSAPFVPIIECSLVDLCSACFEENAISWEKC